MSKHGKKRYIAIILLFLMCILCLTVFHINTLFVVSKHNTYSDNNPFNSLKFTNYKTKVKPKMKLLHKDVSYRFRTKTRSKRCELEISSSRKDKCKRDQFIKHTTIAVLIDWTNEEDIRDLKTKLLPSLQYLKPMSFILFSEHKANSTVQAIIRKTSHHKFKFIDIKFSFPDGFDHNNTVSIFSKRSKWGYMHMIRFWFKNIWLEPAVRTFKYILRFDTDSCLKGKKFSFPSNEDLVYLWSSGRYETGYVTDLKAFILDYIKTNNITIKNAHLFSRYNNDDNNNNNNNNNNNKVKGLPMYYNNMEIASVEFMNRPEVQQFIDAVDTSYGQYKYRWGDAPLRYATLALFAEEKSMKPLGVRHGRGYQHPCKI